MALNNWSAEGGTDGVAVSLANSGGASGTPWDGIVPGAGNTYTYTTSQSMHGTKSVAVWRDSGTAPYYFQRNLPGTATREAFRIYVRFPSIPAGNTGIIRVLNTSASNAASLFVNSAGQILIQNTAGTAIFTSTAALSVDTWYRIEFAISPGTTTTTGAYNFAYYLGDSTTAIQTAGTTNNNFGSVATPGFVRVGRFDSVATAGGYFYDDFATNEISSGFIGPAGVTPPTAAGVGTTDAYVFNMLTSTAGVSGALNFSVAYQSGQTLTVNEPVDGIFVFTTSPDGTATYIGTVSEVGGGTDTMVINVPQRSSGSGWGPRMWTGTPGTPSASWS